MNSFQGKNKLDKFSLVLFHLKKGGRHVLYLLISHDKEVGLRGQYVR